jgi:3-phosphoshikimate 1-carboxyvinyltransferase
VSMMDRVVRLPGSKSVTHRALIAAGLAGGKSVLINPLACEDTDYTRRALEGMGVVISEGNGGLDVRGVGGKFAPVPAMETHFLGNSGTSIRLLLGVTALTGNRHLLDGLERIRERPIGELVDALNLLGAEIQFQGRVGYPPVLVRGKGIRGGKVRLSGKVSSQYLSSLLLVSPFAREDVEIEVGSGLVSSAYVALTLEVMGAFGVKVLREGFGRFHIPSGQIYHSRTYVVEADVSSASYFWGAAAVTGGRVITENIDPYQTCQGDIGFLDILEEMGCVIERNPGWVAVRGGSLRRVEVDMAGMPDLVPTLAAIALFADGETVIRNVPHLRHKESDRLHSVRCEWEKLGGHVKELPDGLVIRGGSALSGGAVDPHDDHRLAMSLAVIGLKVPGVRIDREECVQKSFPGFWDLWEGDAALPVKG